MSRFYPSVYTHSVPWALHTKKRAKIERGDKLVGNLLDRILQQGQDQQTMGIPIGPDTSLLIAERLLRSVDDSLRKKIPSLKGFRYIDDYELIFSTLGEAEHALVILESCLAEYELAVNYQKTRVLELPTILEDPWVLVLRRNIPSAPVGASRMRDFASVAFELAEAWPEASVLKFALKSVFRLQVGGREAGRTLEAFALNVMQHDSSAIAAGLSALIACENAGFRVERARLQQVVASMLKSAAERYHVSEVAWLLWCCLVFRVELHKFDEAAHLVSMLEDDVVALLAMHLNREGMSSIDDRRWRAHEMSEDLRGEHWLLAYELAAGRRSRGEPIGDVPSQFLVLESMLNADVRFYDETQIAMQYPDASASLPGGRFRDEYL